MYKLVVVLQTFASSLTFGTHSREIRTRKFEYVEATAWHHGGEVYRVPSLTKLHYYRLLQYLITTRNDIVTAQLLTQYGGRISGGDLHVFCASNTLYWEKRDLRALAEVTPFLRLSGIVDIRRHCMGLVSESQLRIATKYLRDDVPNLLSNIELWVQNGAGTADAEKKRAVRQALDKLERRLRRVSEFPCP
jgi:hypothetical protein